MNVFATSQSHANVPVLDKVLFATKGMCWIAVATLWLGCSATDLPPRQPEDWDAPVRMARPDDLNPDPRVIEIELVARPAALSLVPAGATPVWTYNGTVPGPLIEAQVGDRLIVHFQNQLPEPTTIHWHGLRVPNAMDGAPGHHSPPIEPGERFDYEFVLPDEGLYWYHPHQRSAAQVAAGLYGAILVRGDDEPVIDELTMMLSDIGVRDQDGSLSPADAGGDVATLFGREGNHVLVNGREHPVVRVRNGLPLRMRFVGAAISRYFQLAIRRHTFEVIGGDRGPLPSGHEIERLLILPGQRADTIVVPRGRSGERLVLRWIPYDRGYGSTEYRSEVDVLVLELVGEPLQVPDPEVPFHQVEPLDPTGATRFEVELTQVMRGGQLVLGFSGVPSWEALPVPARIGDTHVWTFRNTIQWAHPIHLHGYFFQALDEARRVIPEWIDTIDIPVNGERSFVVRYDERPGLWMIHCHVLDHADAGMMGMIEVAP